VRGFSRWHEKKFSRARAIVIEKISSTLLDANSVC